jgi:hypothetical protein
MGSVWEKADTRNNAIAWFEEIANVPAVGAAVLPGLLVAETATIGCPSIVLYRMDAPPIAGE